MKPPYRITSFMLSKVSSISEKLGEVNANYLSKPSPQLRKQNRIRTIHSSLRIEGNTLTEEQVTALLENKRVLGPKKDIQEVLNAIKVYDQLSIFDPFSRESLIDSLINIVPKPFSRYFSSTTIAYIYDMYPACHRLFTIA